MCFMSELSQNIPISAHAQYFLKLEFLSHELKFTYEIK